MKGMSPGPFRACNQLHNTCFSFISTCNTQQICFAIAGVSAESAEKSKCTYLQNTLPDDSRQVRETNYSSVEVFWCFIIFLPVLLVGCLRAVQINFTQHSNSSIVGAPWLKYFQSQTTRTLLRLTLDLDGRTRSRSKITCPHQNVSFELVFK